MEGLKVKIKCAGLDEESFKVAWSTPGSKRGGSSRSLAPWNDLCILIDKVKLVSASQLAVLKYKEEAVWQTQRRHTEGGRKEGAGGGQGGGRRWPVADSRKPRRVPQRQPITVSLPHPYRLPHPRCGIRCASFDHRRRRQHGSHRGQAHDPHQHHRVLPGGNTA